MLIILMQYTCKVLSYETYDKCTTHVEEKYYTHAMYLQSIVILYLYS